MRVMLTSCGLETRSLEKEFLKMLGKDAGEARALFIPTEAVDADSIAVLPKCMNDLIKCGIPKNNIHVYDLHENISMEEIRTFDVIYLCGGKTSYLLNRINETGFRDTLLTYINENGFVIGVSAGSLIFSDSLPNNLGILKTKLSVHCSKTSVIGRITYPLSNTFTLSNTAAILIRGIPNDIIVIDEIDKM